MNAQLPEFRAALDLAPLLGATVEAYAQEEGYWHLFVALRLAGDAPYVFRTEEHPASSRFDVFPIYARHDARTAYMWRELPRPFVIESAVPLWRAEWNVPGASGPTVDSDPHTHFAGRGPVPPQAATRARVLAGVLLQSTALEKIVIAASDYAAFNVDIFLPADVERALERFEEI